MSGAAKPVFISFSSKESALAAELADAFARRGIGTFLSTRDIKSGDNYGSEIVKAIKACERVVVLVSRSATHSEHVRREVQLAINNRKKLLPFSVDGTRIEDIADDDWQYWLSAVQLEPYTDVDEVARRASETVVVDRAMKLAKVSKESMFLIQVNRHGNAVERRLPDKGDDSWPAEVTRLPAGALRIVVGGHDLTAKRESPQHDWLTGLEHGPEGNATFKVIELATEPVPPEDYHLQRWLLISKYHRPSIIDFPENVRGRVTRQYLFEDLNLSHGTLSFQNVTDGVLRLEVHLPVPGGKDEQVWLKSRNTTLGSNSLRLYPIRG